MIDRKDVNINETWDLSLLYKTEDLFNEELENFPKSVNEFVEKYDGKIETADDITATLAEYRPLLQRGGRLNTYSNLAVEANVFDKEATKRLAKTRNILASNYAKLSFVDTDILNLDEDVLKEASKNEEDRVFLEDLLKVKPHTLSKDVESTLKALTNTLNFPYQSYNDIKFRDIDFPNFMANGKEYEMTYNSFEDKYNESNDKEVRREGFRTFSDELNKYKNSTASAYNAQVQYDKTMANLRGYESVFDYLLANQDVSMDLYNRQIDVIMKELAPHMRKFAGLLKKIHGLDTMTYADLKIDVDPNYSPEVTFDEAKQYILDGLSVLGEDYSKIIQEAFDNRWIDYAATKGKRTGAFCSSPYAANSFILMGFNNSMSDCMTLAHELGHAGHFQSAHKKQNILNSRPSLYFIEAPSTTNELLVENYLLDVAKEKNDKKMRRWVLSQMVSKTYYHNFVTHLLEAHYQREVYKMVDKGQSVDADILSELYANTLKEFWGDAVELTKGCELTWMRQPHYYMGLYSYTYSAGLTIGTQMCKKIRSEGVEVAKNWVKVLEMGGTKSPEDLAKAAMVDISTDEPLKDTIAYIGSLIDEIEELTAQLDA
ncbi:MAG: oligoendopeptidase F [Tissierellia bacterium]|nr:oligoendopeptidase F [Tissierellia bacterium]